MTLGPGTKLGPYEITAPLGAGGMGEVWRARDTRLGREVAIKALPAAFAQDAERLARFEREAKLLASLSHPNIAGIHGLEEVGGHRYLVLEFLEGESLAERLARGPLPQDEALEVCREIATGVEAAHENGVVHRDLKPGNVMITPAGAVKVLDFGLAKGAVAGSAVSDPQLSASPTISFAATAAGVILGTAAYMSPEQARGKPVDRRTDIWSFGCVLYECLTGKEVFGGETVSDVMARILERDPDWSALPPSTPPTVRALLERCLTKDPKQRLRDIGEARIVLGEAQGRAAKESAARPAAGAGGSRPSRLARVLPWGVAVAALAAAVALGARGKPETARDPVSLSIMLPREDRLDAGVENQVFAIAPDGKALVYAARREGTVRLFYRPLDSPSAIELPETHEARNPIFSPDGEWVAFFARNELRKVSVRGGTPVTIGEVNGDRGGTWLEDGTLVYSPTYTSPLIRLAAEGGAPVAITTLDSTRSERTHRWPCSLPGNTWVVATVQRQDSPGGYDDADIVAFSLEGSERRYLAKGSMARFAPGNRLIVARAGSLYELPIDPRDPQPGGTPAPVLDGVLGEPTSGAAFFDIAKDGTLIYAAGKGGLEETRLAWATPEGELTPIPGQPRQYSKFQISPDGTRALAEVGPGGGNTSLWLLDLVRGSQARLAVDNPAAGLSTGSAYWMPDGRQYVYVRSRPGQDQVVLGEVGRSDSLRVLHESEGLLTVSDVDTRGQFVLFNEYGTRDSDIWLLDLAGNRPPRAVVQSSGAQTSGVFSPDGKWVAYASNESGQAEILISALDRPGVRNQVSVVGGIEPRWSPDGRFVYFISVQSLCAATIEAREDAVQVETPRSLFPLFSISGDTSIRNFAVDPRTGRLVVRMQPEKAYERREIIVHLGWAGTLATR